MHQVAQGASRTEIHLPQQTHVRERTLRNMSLQANYQYGAKSPEIPQKERAPCCWRLARVRARKGELKIALCNQRKPWKPSEFTQCLKSRFSFLLFSRHFSSSLMVQLPWEMHKKWKCLETSIQNQSNFRAFQIPPFVPTPFAILWFGAHLRPVNAGNAWQSLAINRTFWEFNAWFPRNVRPQKRLHLFKLVHLENSGHYFDTRPSKQSKRWFAI